MTDDESCVMMQPWWEEVVVVSFIHDDDKKTFLCCCSNFEFETAIVDGVGSNNKATIGLRSSFIGGDFGLGKIAKLRLGIINFEVFSPLSMYSSYL